MQTKKTRALPSSFISLTPLADRLRDWTLRAADMAAPFSRRDFGP
jgi:hypothetical protein